PNDFAPGPHDVVGCPVRSVRVVRPGSPLCGSRCAAGRRAVLCGPPDRAAGQMTPAATSAKNITAANTMPSTGTAFLLLMHIFLPTLPPLAISGPPVRLPAVAP